ncbi:fungal trichothecene efflux pump-domain-containing protein [Xylariaceae sp. FL1272]|nr:fungal trichothecene efflux pump-domain-containing protein [Xylariaceae sp. FL1272]
MSHNSRPGEALSDPKKSTHLDEEHETGNFEFDQSALPRGDRNYVWIALSYTLTSAVTLTITGRVSDIFGRRWMFIGGATFGLVGGIVGATAKTIPTFIGGMTIIGIGAATSCLLYTGALLMVILGWNWGGNVYAWSSAYVIGTIIAGFVGLVLFIIWETFSPLNEPLIAVSLFLNEYWVVATVLSGVDAFAIVWPGMVANLYTSGYAINAAWLASLSSISITVGQVLGGLVAQGIGKVRLQIIGSFTLGVLQWGESLAITAVTLTAQNQSELGTTSGTAGPVLIALSRLASTVPAALVHAELPSSSVSGFTTNIPTASFTNIPVVTSDIIDIGLAAYKQAYSDAYRTDFLTTIAFTGVAVISGLMLPNIDNLLSGKVAVTLRRD